MVFDRGCELAHAVRPGNKLQTQQTTLKFHTDSWCNIKNNHPVCYTVVLVRGAHTVSIIKTGLLLSRPSTESQPQRKTVDK